MAFIAPPTLNLYEALVAVPIPTSPELLIDNDVNCAFASAPFIFCFIANVHPIVQLSIAIRLHGERFVVWS